MLRLPPRGEIAFPIPKVQRNLCANVKRMEDGLSDGRWSFYLNDLVEQRDAARPGSAQLKVESR